MAIIKSKTKPTDELFLSNQAAMEMLLKSCKKTSPPSNSVAANVPLLISDKKENSRFENEFHICSMMAATSLKSVSSPLGKCTMSPSHARVSWLASA